MKKRFAILLVAVLALLALTVTAFAANTDYAVVRNSSFEAEQGNLVSTVFYVESDKPVEVLEFHLSYDKGLATLSSTEIFTVGKNTSIKYNDEFYLVCSEMVDGEPEYYFFKTLEGCTDADKSSLTVEKYFTDDHYATVFTLEENLDANAAMIAHIRETYGVIAYDPELQINATAAGNVSVSWLPRQPEKVSGSNLFSLQFTIDENLAAEDYDTWLTANTARDSFADTYNGKALNFSVDITPLSIYEYGDINFDTKIDTRDALLARQHYLEIAGKILSGLKFKYADVNIDGAVNTRDALEIQQKTIGLKDHVGNRFNVYFHDADGKVVVIKSVAEGNTILNIPGVPEPKGYINGAWSASSEEYVEIDFSASITRETHLYAYYEEHISEVMQYYVDTLRMRYNTNYNRGVALDSILKYGGSASTTEAEITWFYQEDDGTITGVAKNEAGQYVLEQPGYDTEMTLQAYIVSWQDGKMESNIQIPVEIKLKGKFSTPTKLEIIRFLRKMTMGDISQSSVTGGTIEYDVHLARKLTNNDIGASSSYEVRLEWYRLVNGVYEPVTEIKRTTSTQEHQNFMTIVTFNGVPLEGDGKIYFDDVTITPVTETEIRNYIIESISASTPPTVTDGIELWNNDDTYGTTVTWLSKNMDIITVDANVIAINPDAISGMSCPMTAQVTYATDKGANTFELGYSLAVVTQNSLLQPGVNMDPSLYYALLDTLDVKQLTTEHLKKTEFVSLDLSKYSETFENGAGETCLPITSLKGITYCENLFLLNISKLNITDGLEELCTLKRLETLIAKDANIETLKFGAKSALAGMINLKLLDVSGNNIKSLGEILDPDTKYTKLKELYANDNRIEDVEAIAAAPFLKTIELSNNNISDINPIRNASYVVKLSLSNNRIETLNGLEELSYITELRLQNNQIGTCSQIADLVTLEELYLGGNRLEDVSYLQNLIELKTLFLNENPALKSVDALESMEKLEVLQISDCSIVDLGTLYSLVNMKELYAENNKLGSFFFVKQWVNLEKLLLAGNPAFDESEVIGSWLEPMANLKVLTLSGRKLNDLSFLITTNSDTQEETVKKIVRLEIANCDLPLIYANGATEGVLNEYTDNIAILVALIDTLRYLDIGGNNLTMDLSNFTFSADKPKDVTDLRLLSQLNVLYINDTQLGENAATITSAMSRLSHLSMENCGIMSMDCLGTSTKLVYANIANNPITSGDLAKINSASWAFLQELYLDTTVPGAAMLDPGASIGYMGKNSIKGLSLAGYSFPSMSYVPQLNSINYLNLSGTEISSWHGNDAYEKGKSPDRYGQSIMRFADTLQILDIANESAFTHDTLNMLYDEFGKRGTTVYLYQDESKSGFNGQREFNHIVENWSEENRTISMSEFTLVSGSDWKADFAQFVEDYLGFKVTDWTVAEGGPNGAFTKGADGMMHLDDSKYGFEQDTTMKATLTIQVYDAVEETGTSEPVTINVLAGKRSTITIVHRYWSVVDSRNGSFNPDGSGEVITETVKMLDTKSYIAKIKGRSGFQNPAEVRFTVNGDKTIVFDYPRKLYTLTFDPNGGNCVAGSESLKLYYGESTDLFDFNRKTGSGHPGIAAKYFPTRGNYLFAGWLKDGSVLRENFTMPASNVTMTADWVLAVYGVSVAKTEISDKSTYANYYSYFKEFKLNISDADWAKINEYGKEAYHLMDRKIEEINDGYQAIHWASLGTDGAWNVVYQNKNIETAGDKKGSDDKFLQEDKFLSLSQSRGTWHLYMGAHGNNYDNYYITISLYVTYRSKY